MVICQHCNKKINSFLKRVFGLASGFLFILLMARCADARDFFSKQYGLPCKQCHTKIPNLKEFGQNFKNNGYSLEKRAPNPNETPGGGEATVVQQQLSSAANTQKNANEKSKEDSALTMPSSPPPEKPEYLYKWREKGGTYVFTDNPLRIPVENIARKTKKNVGNTKKSRRRDVRTNKSAFSGMPQKKYHKNITASAGTAGMRKPGGPEHAAEQQPASIAEALPHNFEECMGKVLIKGGKPKNGKEMMELFEMAESSCAPYATKR